MSKPEQNPPPLFSIVTIVYNRADEIELTLKSVQQQSCRDYEYLVIDGNSNDGTREILERYRSDIDTLISEPDKGIYDAMNKGLQHASGQYILFLNAGDRFADVEVLSDVQRQLQKTPCDALYGDHIIQYPDGSRLHQQAPDNLDNLYKRMQFSHQALFLDTGQARLIGFDTRYRIAADYNMIFQAYLKGLRFEHFKRPICLFEPGGASDQKRVLAVWERFIINRKLRNTPGIYPVYGLMLLSALIKQTAKKIMTPARYDKLKRRWYQNRTESPNP